MSTLLHRLVLSIELGIVQTGTGKVDPARKFKCTTASRELNVPVFLDKFTSVPFKPSSLCRKDLERFVIFWFNRDRRIYAVETRERKDCCSEEGVNCKGYWCESGIILSKLWIRWNYVFIPSLCYLLCNC